MANNFTWMIKGSSATHTLVHNVWTSTLENNPRLVFHVCGSTLHPTHKLPKLGTKFLFLCCRSIHLALTRLISRTVWRHLGLFGQDKSVHNNNLWSIKGSPSQTGRQSMYYTTQDQIQYLRITIRLRSPKAAISKIWLPVGLERLLVS